jgi:hypothetical protein
LRITRRNCGVLGYIACVLKNMFLASVCAQVFSFGTSPNVLSLRSSFLSF